MWYTIPILIRRKLPRVYHLEMGDSINLYYVGVSGTCICRQLRARRALMVFNIVILRTVRVISLFKVYGDSTLLVIRPTMCPYTQDVAKFAVTQIAAN